MCCNVDGFDTVALLEVLSDIMVLLVVNGCKIWSHHICRWQEILNGIPRLKNVDIWEEEVSKLEKWLLKHLAWMDGQLIQQYSTAEDQLTEG